MIKAVTLDFWNTLYREDGSARTRRRERRVTLAQSFFAAAGKNLESRVVRTALERAGDKLDELQWQQHAMSHAELGQAIATELGFRLDEAHAGILAEAVSSAGREHPPLPIEGAADLLARLHGKVRVGIISDTSMTFGMHLRQVMASDGLAKYVDHFTWSDETLTCKPMARQFLYTADQLGARPDETVHVGDLERRDVGGARSAGMRCIRILSDGDSRGSDADATVRALAGVPAVLERWGAAL